MSTQKAAPVFRTESMADLEELLEAAAGYVEQTTRDDVIAAELRAGAEFVREATDGE